MLATLGVSRVLNLVEDDEYTRGARRKVERALAVQGSRSAAWHRGLRRPHAELLERQPPR